MPPRKKEIPVDDVTIHIMGLKTLRSRGMSLEGIANYYSKVLESKCSRRTVKRRIVEMEKADNVKDLR